MTRPESDSVANDPKVKSRRWGRKARTVSPLASRLHRVVMLAAIAPVAGLVGSGAPQLLWEFTGLRAEWTREEDSRVMGYVEIAPQLNFSEPPGRWLYDEDGKTRLWAGWIDKQGHDWFEFPVGELETKQIGDPLGRDVIRAIDVPVEERRGDERWEMLSDRAVMYEFETNGVWTAYPLLVLQKVMLVNDQPGGRPILICYASTEEGAVAGAYQAQLPGLGRLTFGTVGCTLGKEYLFYDRTTRSLWIEGEEGMEAVAGRLRGTVLPRVSTPACTTWGRWSEAHPGGRLIVGADRKGGIAKR